MSKLTPEGRAVAEEMKRQGEGYWKARLWDHDAIGRAAVEASDKERLEAQWSRLLNALDNIKKDLEMP